MAVNSDSVIQRLELVKNMIQLGETEALEAQADRLRSTDGASALHDIADCLSHQRYSDAVARIDEYLQSEAAVESSDYLYHFTESRDTLKSIVENGLWVQYSCEDVSFLKGILGDDWDPRLDDRMAADKGNTDESEHNGDVQGSSSDRYKIYIPMACFCDIPHDRLGGHVKGSDSKKYNPYGIVFDKAWGIEKGVNPVSYVVPESGFSAAFQDFNALTEDFHVDHEDQQIRSVFLKLLQFLKPYEDEEKRYYDEREWRYIPSGVPEPYTKSEFESQDIDKVHSSLDPTFGDIKCLIVNENSEVEDMKSFLRQDLNGDADKVPVRTFEDVEANGITN